MNSLSPTKQGLYHPKNEHDSCGVGFVANIDGRKSHQIIENGLEILKNLTHRGAVGADPNAGDGAGVLLQISDEFFRKVIPVDLPDPGFYAVGMVFMPQSTLRNPNILKERGARITKRGKTDQAQTGWAEAKGIVERYILDEGQSVLCWRRVTVNNSSLGASVLPTEPDIWQVIVGRDRRLEHQDDFERKLFVIRKQIEKRIRQSDIEGNTEFYITTLSSRLINYKGMLLANQVAEYYPDLLDPDMVSAFALVHQRFSTNTFPTWDLAHPFRMIAHNGEINTLRGNINWMAARKSTMFSDVLGDDIDKIWPVIPDGQSDSAAFDNALELLVAGGYSLTHAMMMLIPEAWSGNTLMNPQHRAFYEYHAALMEPWDGPAAVAFTDGKQIGATLDRNGLRPARYLITKDNMVVMASEMGVLNIPENNIKKKWRLQPGKMFLIDLEQGRIVDDQEIKHQLASLNKYQAWLDNTQIELGSLRIAIGAMSPDTETLLKAQQAFGYTQEDLKFLLLPMVQNGEEALGSMGTDVPPAVLSNKPKHLSHFFKQNFAQVTNPPIDPIREELVMSLLSLIGPRPNLFGQSGGERDGGQAMRLTVPQPLLTNNQLERVRQIEDHTNGAFRTKTLNICYAINNKRGKDSKQEQQGLKDAIQLLCDKAEQAVLQKGFNILILSDRRMDADNIAIPALLATSAVHHHLIKTGLRTESGLVIETGACLEVHHFATLAGYGAEAINPYMAFDSINNMLGMLNQRLNAKCPKGKRMDFEEAQQRYIRAVNKGLKKVMSKMGISTYQSYCGAQIFDAVGLSENFIDTYFKGTSSTIQGIGLAEIARDILTWHHQAYGDHPLYRTQLDAGGDYAYRTRGEVHIWNPETISKLQHATRGKNPKTFEAFSEIINKQDKALFNLRGLFEFQWADKQIPIDQVEPAEVIVKRFSTGAMSFGSISHEAHSTLAIAMNQIGGKSNTGEGGEEEERYRPLKDGSKNPKRSAIKQIASGRFGVTTDYLVNADDIQIKMAQGAKPGEGGQLPGYKVSEQIARVRHSTAGVGLISPPPHHDIYSIEDLAQLIFDLKNVNPEARISVKLVSEVGVGTVAAGVSKAHADHVTISGYEGGTGASPLTSIKHAGSPWEIGLAETHQTLVLNKLRGRIAVQVDGGVRTGRDVAIGALLGADEFGFATAPLIVQGCLMMRKCHLNTCPVGIATQNPVLRKKFTGQAEHVINYFFFIAEQLRQIMSRLGYATVDEMIGQMDRLKMTDAIEHWKAKGLDYSRILTKPAVDKTVAVYQCEQQDHGLENVLDRKIIIQAKPALEKGQSVSIGCNSPSGDFANPVRIRNTNRAFGAMLSGLVVKKHGHAGLPDDTIYIKAKGTAGQSFGAWLAQGVTIELEGEANDYVGKGLSGGKLVIYPPADSAIDDQRDNIIVGNTVLYGAISGQVYFNGVAGERFCVRNSGAVAVVEGVGDHGCEYMTGGVVVCLGLTGRNFAAGMSGGIAYVLDEDGQFDLRCNQQMVTLEMVDEDAANENSDNLLEADEARLKRIIGHHKNFTGSAIANRILDNWSAYRQQFIKIVPHDFQQALLKIYQATSHESEYAPAIKQTRHG
ncbi:glutamate synthase large subunit [Candidatus Spongiihabitans sp.]|uniref:glutamate synthase large subunit n=1 Tax=Candidatus Spongiihabitans sp. TaxID=3101308 RepID=UPI003C6FCC63